MFYIKFYVNANPIAHSIVVDIIMEYFRFALNNMNMSAPDYDGRTALHLAGAEGHLEIVQLLIEQCNVNPEPKDRYVLYMLPTP